MKKFLILDGICLLAGLAVFQLGRIISAPIIVIVVFFAGFIGSQKIRWFKQYESDKVIWALMFYFIGCILSASIWYVAPTYALIFLLLQRFTRYYDRYTDTFDILQILLSMLYFIWVKETSHFWLFNIVLAIGFIAAVIAGIKNYLNSKMQKGKFVQLPIVL